MNLINNREMINTAYIKSIKKRDKNEIIQSQKLLKLLTLSFPFIFFSTLPLDQTLLYVSIIDSGV